MPVSELKPCPFCGCEARAQENGRRPFFFWEIACDNCDYTAHAQDTRGQSIEAWNRRAALSLPQGAPEGWKLVPLVPTPKMLAPYHGLNRTRDTSNLAERIYAAMLAASPDPEGL